jgi:hypothetical protein
MNEVCAALDLPGKTGVDGSKVSDMYDNGEIEGIRRYCETDVLNTYLLYLRYVLHTGLSDHDGYNHAINLTVAWLEERAGDIPRRLAGFKRRIIQSALRYPGFGKVKRFTPTGSFCVICIELRIICD